MLLAIGWRCCSLVLRAERLLLAPAVLDGRVCAHAWVPLAEKLAVLFAGAAGRKAAVGASRWARVCMGAGACRGKRLGCFGLTEKFAGVSSGMVVESIAEVDLQMREFLLTSPNEGAYKNWISQGFVDGFSGAKAVTTATVCGSLCRKCRG